MSEQLTEKQIALLMLYQAKWRQFARSTDRLDLEKATAAIALAYRQFERPAPKILFFPSPIAASDALYAKLSRHRWGTNWLRSLSDIATGIMMVAGLLIILLFFPFCVLYGLKLLPEVLLNAIGGVIALSTLVMLLMLPIMLVLNPFADLVEQLALHWNRFQIDRRWGKQLPALTQPWSTDLLQATQSTAVCQHRESESGDDTAAQLRELIQQRSDRQSWERCCPNHRETLKPLFQLPVCEAELAAAYDFCISVLGCKSNLTGWQTLSKLIQQCSFILPFEHVCLVCDRPIQLRVDSDAQFHAEGEPAIEFPDRARWYFHHGIQLPEQYGSVMPQQWQAQWVLSEHNSTLKQMLVETIGYAKLCEQLDAIVLDAEDGNTLFKIERFIWYEFDIYEALHVLRMTSQETEFYWWRVPTSVETVQAAIDWLSDPDDDEFL